MRCSKSCYLRDLELVDLFNNGVIEQVYCNIELRCSIPLKRHSFDKNDLRYIQKEIEQGAKK